MNSFEKLWLTWLVALLAVFFIPAQAGADEVLWKSGINLYIKLTRQDKPREGRPLPNQHPVSLSRTDLANALRLPLVREKHYLKKNRILPVFSASQVSLLSQYLAAGLRKARPDEDIVFALISKSKKYLVLQDSAYMSGRIFYANDRLNIIIGDFDKPPDKFKERSQKSAGISEIQYFFKQGRRARPSGFKMELLLKDGIDNYQDGDKKRRDWIVIDVKQAAATYVAGQQGNKKTANSVSDEVIRREAAKIARERREMKLELARMRKEMRSSGSNDSNGRSIEARLATLHELYEKKLITKEEFDMKRKELLSEI